MLRVRQSTKYRDRSSKGKFDSDNNVAPASGNKLYSEVYDKEHQYDSFDTDYVNDGYESEDELDDMLQEYEEYKKATKNPKNPVCKQLQKHYYSCPNCKKLHGSSIEGFGQSDNDLFFYVLLSIAIVFMIDFFVKSKRWFRKSIETRNEYALKKWK